MLIAQYINTSYPTLQLTDKVAAALQLMEDYDVLHLPVKSEDKYVGLVAKEDLLDVDDQAAITVVENHFIRALVKSEQHFTAAVKVAIDHGLSMVPVLGEDNELLGVVIASELLKIAARFIGVEEPGGIIVLEMDRRNFSFGEISRLVETNDAYITQLNTTIEPEHGLLLATVKINKFEISDIIATFQRYEYNVKYFFGEENYQNELRQNYDLLMTYLKM